MANATTLHLPAAFDDREAESEYRRMVRGAPGQVADDIAGYRLMGIRSVVCNLRAESTDEIRRAIETFARHVKPGLDA